MRVSADPRHPDFHPFAYRATVCLDGGTVERVLFADEEAGRLVVARVDAQGLVQYANGEVLTDVLQGHVRVYRDGKRWVIPACTWAA